MNMKKHLDDTLIKSASQEEAISMLFCNLTCSMNDTILYFNDIQEKPKRRQNTSRFWKMICYTHWTRKKALLWERKSWKKRVREWTQQIGQPSIPILIYMVNYSRVTYNELSADKITLNTIKYLTILWLDKRTIKKIFRLFSTYTYWRNVRDGWIQITSRTIFHLLLISEKRS